MPSQCHLVVRKLGIRMQWWGRPPGPLLCNEISLIESQRADQGVGCGPGGPPHKRTELSGFGTTKWRGLSVCRADTLVGAQVEKSLDPAGRSAWPRSAFKEALPPSDSPRGSRCLFRIFGNSVTRHRSQERAHPVPDNLHPDANQQKRRQPQDHRHARHSQYSRQPVRESIA